MPSSRQIAFERSSRSRASSKRPRRAYRYGPPRSASASTAARPRSLRPGELFVEEGEHLVDGVRPKIIAPPTSFQASTWRRVSPDARRVSLGLLKRPELRASVARGQLGEAHELPGIREVRIAVDRLEHRDRPTRDVAQWLGVGRGAHEGNVGALHLGSELGRPVVVGVARASIASARASRRRPRALRRREAPGRGRGATTYARRARPQGAGMRARAAPTAAANSPRSSARRPARPSR